MGKYLQTVTRTENGTVHDKNDQNDKSPVLSVNTGEESYDKRVPEYDKRVPVSDPRPDLAEDHGLWQDLLSRAGAIDGDDPDGIFGSLHGFRCSGARLLSVNGKVRLDAGFPDCIWQDTGAYARDRTRWLVPHHGVLTQLLTELR